MHIYKCWRFSLKILAPQILYPYYCKFPLVENCQHLGCTMTHCTSLPSHCVKQSSKKQQKSSVRHQWCTVPHRHRMIHCATKCFRGHMQSAYECTDCTRMITKSLDYFLHLLEMASISRVNEHCHDHIPSSRLRLFLHFHIDLSVIVQ